ncbi:class I SAM-dependent methyltransferase [Pelagicoccus albus]|uniref:Methyltransferase domain-containing protein n=1 Tax=Pelagicoccus albus TaxID=415222 RepID=A0A7X1B7T5_9BACT|nr:class I SAM-dependent methyltransferase [Pelagicoccus albus]MBC2605985.1 methyltransferase domain-containing protein [Pelagicoccus albus]
MELSDRSNYKKTWEDLSQDFETAQHYVAGHNDETEFERSAQVTLGVLRETVGVKDSDDFLEIGCGVGRVGKVLSPIVKSWTGSDISSGMVKQAGSYLEACDNVSLVHLERSSLSQFQDESFDVVYCTVVFMHLLEWDRYRYVSEALRILKPGGRIYFDNVDIRSDHGWKVFTDGYNIPVEKRPAQISMVSSADELLTYGEKAGFENCRIHRWGGAWVALVANKPE